MRIPFTLNEFMSVFVEYNRAFGFVPVITYALGIAAVVLVLRGGVTKDRLVSAVLAAFWIWNGAAYHIGFFRAINPPATVFGALFIMQGLLFLILGVLGRRLPFAGPRGVAGWGGGTFIVYAMVLYPILGHLLGHVYPASPVFGMAPCPTTIFTFGMLLLVRERVPGYLLVIPVLWSIVGLSAAVSLGIYEDFGLTIAGLCGTVLLLRRARRGSLPAPAGAARGIVIGAVLSMAAIAAQPAAANAANDTLLTGGFGGPAARVDVVSDEPTLFVGGRGGFLLKDRLSVGGGGYVGIPLTNADDRAAGYGGLCVELFLFPGRRVNVSVDTLLGAGGTEYRDDDGATRSEAFLAVEPGLHVNLRLTEVVTLSPGVRYLHTIPLSGTTAGAENLRSLSAAILLRFGRL